MSIPKLEPKSLGRLKTEESSRPKTPPKYQISSKTAAQKAKL